MAATIDYESTVMRIILWRLMEGLIDLAGLRELLESADSLRSLFLLLRSSSS